LPVDNRRAEELNRAFIHCYTKLKGKQIPSFSIQFYPYSTFRHTIRLRSGHILIRISDVIAEAPIEVLSALICILLYRLYRRRPPAESADLYRRYANSADIRQKARQARRTRGKKLMGAPRGQTFDLQRLFDKLNHEYFGDRVRVSRVGWSLRRSKRTLGHFDSAHKTITISRSLDSPVVPEYVVEYVLYHEMLHALFDDETRNGGTRIHDRRFLEAERRFSRYAAAQAFIRTSL